LVSYGCGRSCKPLDLTKPPKSRSVAANLGRDMEDELMEMEVAPVMEPQSMPQGTPAGSVLPQELQASIDSLSEEEKNQAKQALMQIMRIVEQMEADGATPEQIEQFLNEIGMTLEELEMAEEMFGMGEGALGFEI